MLVKNICTTMGVDGGDDEIFEVDFVPQNRISAALHEIANINLKKITQEQIYHYILDIVREILKQLKRLEVVLKLRKTR